MTPAQRTRIEQLVDVLIALLDGMDGDSDLEPEPVEEQQDGEADLTWTSGIAPGWFIIAESARRKTRRRR